MQTHARWLTTAIILLIATFRPVAGMELEKAEALALEHDPALSALAKRVESAEAMAVADSALPDPELILGAQGVPVDDPLDADMMTQYRVGLRQRIPAGGSRSALRRAGERKAAGLRASLQARKLELLRQTRRAWIDWAAALKSLELARSSRSAFEDLLAITEARYRSGTGRQRDINQARLELALLDQRIFDRLSALEEAAARVERWTGRAPDPDPGTTPAFPDWRPPGDVDLLERRLAAHPAILTLEAQMARGQAQVDRARSAYRPEWMIEAGYGHTRGTDPMTRHRQSDKLFAMVSFSLPLFTANRQDRRLAAAEAEREALSQDIATRLRELRGELDRQSRLQRSHERRLEALEQDVLTEAERTVEATLASYRSDRATFDEVVRSRLALLEQELAAIELRRMRLRAAIEVEYLTGDIAS